MEICDKTGKYMFPTRRSAMRSVKGVARRGRLSSRAETYYCRSCKSWHFGRKKESPGRHASDSFARPKKALFGKR